jgi:hypothetical protein
VVRVGVLSTRVSSAIVALPPPRWIGVRFRVKLPRSGAFVFPEHPPDFGKVMGRVCSAAVEAILESLADWQKACGFLYELGPVACDQRKLPALHEYRREGSRRGG